MEKGKHWNCMYAPFHINAKHEEVSCRISHCSILFQQKFQAVSQPDLHAGFGNEECQVASQALYVCFCNCRNAWMFQAWETVRVQHSSRSLENKTINISRKGEKYREVLWLLCHYYAITMPLLWGTVDTWCWDWEWHGMTTWLQQHIVAPWHKLLLSGYRALAFWNSAENAKSLSLQTFCMTPK